MSEHVRSRRGGPTTRTDLTDALDTLIVKRREAAGQERSEVLSDRGRPGLHRDMARDAIDAALADDMRHLGHVRRMAREYMTEEQS